MHHTYAPLIPTVLLLAYTMDNGWLQKYCASEFQMFTQSIGFSLAYLAWMSLNVVQTAHFPYKRDYGPVIVVEPWAHNCVFVAVFAIGVSVTMVKLRERILAGWSIDDVSAGIEAHERRERKKRMLNAGIGGKEGEYHSRRMPQLLDQKGAMSQRA